MKVFMLNFFKDNLLILFICAVAFFIMLLYSPFTAMYWLLLFTFYYLFKAKYKNIFIIWSFFFFTWYLVFTLLMVGYEGKILLGGEHTSDILKYLVPIIVKYRFLKRFSFNTVFSLHILADSYGFIIYIPSLFKGLLALVKFFFGGGKDSGKGSISSNMKDSGTYKKPPSPDVSPEPSPTRSPTTDFSFFNKFSKGFPDPSPKVPDPQSPPVVSKSQEDHMKDAMAELEKRQPWIKSLDPVDWEIRQTSKDSGVFCCDMYLPITRYRGTRAKGCIGVTGEKFWKDFGHLQKGGKK